MLRALALTLLLTAPTLLAPPFATPARAEDAAVAQENPSPPPAPRRHECERQQEGVS